MGWKMLFEMVVKVVSQGQAVPKNRSGFGIVPDTTAGIVLEEALFFCRRYVVLQCLCWAEEGGETVTGL